MVKGKLRAGEPKANTSPEQERAGGTGTTGVALGRGWRAGVRGVCRPLVPGLGLCASCLPRHRYSHSATPVNSIGQGGRFCPLYCGHCRPQEADPRLSVLTTYPTPHSCTRSPPPLPRSSTRSLLSVTVGQDKRAECTRHACGDNQETMSSVTAHLFRFAPGAVPGA